MWLLVSDALEKNISSLLYKRHTICKGEYTKPSWRGSGTRNQPELANAHIKSLIIPDIVMWFRGLNRWSKPLLLKAQCRGLPDQDASA
ncbi:unnamed protein product [Boreogadus saida]